MMMKKKLGVHNKTLFLGLSFIVLIYAGYLGLFGEHDFWPFPEVALSAGENGQGSNSKQVTPSDLQITTEIVKARQALAEGDIQATEKILKNMQALLVNAESRSLEIKIIGLELIKLLTLVVIVLIIIALAFPLGFYLLSQKRILGLSGLSSEVSATLLVVEERQSKLANILKDIQGEMDYLQSMSVPDLKKLIQQAESYIKQNEQDLDKAGIRKQEPLRTETTPKLS